jgi:hypothetical protein
MSIAALIWLKVANPFCHCRGSLPIDVVFLSKHFSAISHFHSTLKTTVRSESAQSKQLLSRNPLLAFTPGRNTALTSVLLWLTYMCKIAREPSCSTSLQVFSPAITTAPLSIAVPTPLIILLLRLSAPDAASVLLLAAPFVTTPVVGAVSSVTVTSSQLSRLYLRILSLAFTHTPTSEVQRPESSLRA